MISCSFMSSLFPSRSHFMLMKRDWCQNHLYWLIHTHSVFLSHGLGLLLLIFIWSPFDLLTFWIAHVRPFDVRVEILSAPPSLFQFSGLWDRKAQRWDLNMDALTQGTFHISTSCFHCSQSLMVIYAALNIRNEFSKSIYWFVWMYDSVLLSLIKKFEMLWVSIWSWFLFWYQISRQSSGKALWSVSIGICDHSVTRALVRLGTDIGCLGLPHSQFILMVCSEVEVTDLCRTFPILQPRQTISS